MFHVVDAICVCHCVTIVHIQERKKRTAQGTSIINAKTSHNFFHILFTFMPNTKERKICDARRKYLYFDCENRNLFQLVDLLAKCCSSYWFSFCFQPIICEVKQTYTNFNQYQNTNHICHAQRI